MIEVMGLAVLPARLAVELDVLKEAMLQHEDLTVNPQTASHAVWAAEVQKQHPEFCEENAEAILNKLGIPVSVFIDMTYRQVIMHDGIPFSLEIPNKLATRDQMSELEFNTMMATGLAQAKADDSYSVDDAFANLRMEIGG